MILLSPIMLLFYQENGLTVKELFFFQGIFYLVSILIELPIGYFSDLFSKKKVLMVSFSIFLFAIVLWYFFKGYWIILAGEILYAVSKVSMDISASGYLYEYLKSANLEGEMPKYLGYMNFYLAAGTATVGFLGAFLYSHFGSSKMLILEFILITIGILLLNFLTPVAASKNNLLTLKEKYKDFLCGIKFILEDKKIKYYILYSGLLTSISILFAVSFQPLMQLAAFPVILFGAVSFFNHGLRAFFSMLAGKLPFSVHQMRVPLYFLYIMSFIFIFILNKSKHIGLNFTLIIIICIVIGFQLLFTILHISRLHKYLQSTCRGMGVSVNNIVPKILTVIILLSVRFFMQNTEMSKFFFFYFIFFIIAGLILLIKTRNITE